MAGSNLRTTVTADASQHNAELNKAAAQVSAFAKKSKDAERSMRDMQNASKAASSSISGMMNALRSGDIAGFVSNLGGASSGLRGLTAGLTGATGAASGLGLALKAALGPVGLIVGAIGAIGGIVGGAVSASAELETHMDQLSSLTGLTGDALSGMEDKAIDMSKQFGTAAGDIVDSMIKIGSAAPELLKDTDALAKVAEAADVLSAASGMTAEESAAAITTTMNQFGVSGKEAMNIINVMSASAQKGAADIKFVAKNFEICGTLAKNAGLDYTQLAAMVETIAPKFGSAEQAAQSLKSVLNKLETGDIDKFKPSVVGLEQALTNLKDANMDTTQMVKMFGTEGLNAANALIEGKDACAQFQQDITGTNAAIEMANTNTDNFAGNMKRIKAETQAALLEFGKTEGMQALSSYLNDIMKDLGEMVVDIVGCVQAFFEWKGVQAVIAIIGAALKGVIEVLKFIIKWVKAVLTLWAAVFKKIWDVTMGVIKNIKNWFVDLWNSIKDNSIVRWFAKVWNKIKDMALKAIKAVADMWDQFMDWLGADSLKLNIGVAPKVDEGEFKEEIKKATPDPDEIKVDATVNSGGVKGGGSKGGGKGSSKEPKIDYLVAIDDNSYDMATKKLQAWQEKQKTLNINDVEGLDQCNKEIEKWKAEVKKRGLALGIVQADTKPVEGSIKYLENMVSALNDELNNTNVSDARLQEILKEKAELEAQIKLIKERNGLLEVKPKVDPNSIKGIQEQLSQAKAQLDLEVVGSDKYNELAQRIAELTEQEHKVRIQIDKDTMPDFEKQAKAIEEHNKKLQDAGSAAQSFAGIGSTLVSALGNSNDEFTKFVGTTIDGIGQMIPQILALIGMKNAEAIAEGTASGASLPFPANIAAIASIVATIAGIFAALPKHANGGIIGGSTTIGDYNLARVNKGEMILNGTQQSRLFRMLSTGGGFADSSTNPTYTVKVKGSDLWLAMNNYNNIKKKTRR